MYQYSCESVYSDSVDSDFVFSGGSIFFTLHQWIALMRTPVTVQSHLITVRGHFPGAESVIKMPIACVCVCVCVLGVRCAHRIATTHHCWNFCGRNANTGFAVLACFAVSKARRRFKSPGGCGYWHPFTLPRWFVLSFHLLDECCLKWGAHAS